MTSSSLSTTVKSAVHKAARLVVAGLAAFPLIEQAGAASPAAAESLRLPSPVLMASQSPAAVRRQQHALILAGGDYAGFPDGRRSPMYVAAVKRYQTSRGWPATGHLTADQARELDADAEAFSRSVGLRVMVDRTTGIEMAIPTALVDAARPTRTEIGSILRGVAFSIELVRVENVDGRMIDRLHQICGTWGGHQWRTTMERTLDNGFRMARIQASAAGDGLDRMYCYFVEMGGEVVGYRLAYNGTCLNPAGYRLMSALAVTFQPLAAGHSDAGGRLAPNGRGRPIRHAAN